MERVTVSPYSDTPWEEVTGKEMWYKVLWFDGRDVHIKYLDRGVWFFETEVLSSSLSVFVFYPLGSLSPIAGFREMGGGNKVWLTPEDGHFGEMLIETAEEYPLVVGELSIEKLKKRIPDLGAIEREGFLSSLLMGTLDSSEIALAKKFKVPLDGIMKGTWVSIYSQTQNIIVSNVYEPGTVSLFPGKYHYLCVERNLMLTITLEESGKYWTRMSSPPEW